VLGRQRFVDFLENNNTKKKKKTPRKLCCTEEGRNSGDLGFKGSENKQKKEGKAEK